MASRTIVLAGVAGIVIAAGAYYYLNFMDDAPPPRAAAPAKPVAAAPKAEVAPNPPAVAAAPGTPPSADEVKAARSKVGDLEKTVADLQGQIAMKDKAIAELETRLAKSK